MIEKRKHSFYAITAYGETCLMWSGADVARVIWEKNFLYKKGWEYLVHFTEIGLSGLAEVV